ncbi:unnamed protein product [Thlaspi arvense]|uniref:F-box protein n=1 Tax=Thlaspi arvense TaxID=13288 RepID=A0AAU9RUL7_THLAR|nr:unnamed protein product [Thlaspi arvense]
MSEQVMVLGKVNKGISKTSSVQGYESAWLGRWTQLGNEVKNFHDQNNGESKKDLIRPEDNVKENQKRKSGKEEGVEVLPFRMFKVSQKRDITRDDVGSSSKAMANRLPWMYVQGDNAGVSSNSHLDFPIQEKTTQNLLELIRPVRFYATVDSVSLPEEDGGHQVLKNGSTVSMKLKGKIFGGYLDLFPNKGHQHKGGVKLQSLESSEDGPKKNESSAETDVMEIDRLQTIHRSDSISSSSTKGKGRKGDSCIQRAEIPDMNEEPPLVLDRENSIEEGHQGETSNSATQSMNVDQFLSRECKRVRLEPELEPGSSRWVKRLKTNASDETKSLMEIEEASQGQKGNNNNLFLEILKSGINNLQPKNHQEQPAAATSQIKNLNQGGEEDITLSHPWIQRWCKKKDTSTNQPGGGHEGSFEPENQKELEKKQYPSIAAMALMGKALSGLNPYGLRKTDSLMVWNARDLR